MIATNQYRKFWSISKNAITNNLYFEGKESPQHIYDGNEVLRGLTVLVTNFLCGHLNFQQGDRKHIRHWYH